MKGGNQMESAKYQVRIIRPDGTEGDWRGDQHPTLEEMQAWVGDWQGWGQVGSPATRRPGNRGGYIEHIVVMVDGKRCDALINEGGKLQGLPVNAKATEMYVYGAEDPIVGNIAIFEKGKLE